MKRRRHGRTPEGLAMKGNRAGSITRGERQKPALSTAVEQSRCKFLPSSQPFSLHGRRATSTPLLSLLPDSRTYSEGGREAWMFGFSLPCRERDGRVRVEPSETERSRQTALFDRESA